MIRTKDFTHEEINHALDALVEDMGDYFRSGLNRDGCHLMIAYPKCLRLSPCKVRSPYATTADVDGTLSDLFGSEYSKCRMSFTAGNYRVASESNDNRPEFQITYSMQQATHLLIFVDWMVGCPPKDSGSESELGRRLHTNYFYRNDDDDMDHGEDIWVIPLDAIPEIRDKIAGIVNYGTTVLDSLWRDFDLTRPYYRQKIEELADQLKPYRIELDFQEDYLVAEVSDEARNLVGDALDEPIWYNADGRDRMERVLRNIGQGGLPPFLRQLFGDLPGAIVIGGF